MSGGKPIIIFGNSLLSSSVTFVRSQAEALKLYKPYYAGSRLVNNGLSLPAERTYIVNQGGVFGKVNEAFFKVYGLAPLFYRKLKEIHPELIHAHFGIGGVLALAIKKYLQIPLIVTFHGSDATTKDEFKRNSYYSERKFISHRENLKHHADLFIAVSEFIRRKLLEQDFPEEKILVHYIGVDTDLFCPDPQTDRQDIVLFVGSLLENKGCHYLIQAMEEVQKLRPETELVIIGEGPQRDVLKQLAAKKLRKYRFLGTQPPNAVRKWMKCAKIFCVPSITIESGASEAFGIVFAEAQASGLPVVSFDTGGIGEAVAHGESGLLTTERNWEGLVSYILRLLEDRDLWERFSIMGMNRVRSKFDLDKQTQKLEATYKLIQQHTQLERETSSIW